MYEYLITSAVSLSSFGFHFELRTVVIAVLALGVILLLIGILKKGLKVILLGLALVVVLGATLVLMPNSDAIQRATSSTLSVISFDPQDKFEEGEIIASALYPSDKIPQRPELDFFINTLSPSDGLVEVAGKDCYLVVAVRDSGVSITITKK